MQTVDPVGTDPTLAFQTDQPLYQAPFQTLLMVAQAAAAQAELGIDSQWLAVVLGDLAARLQAGENQADLLEALLNLSVVPNRGTTAQDLITYANDFLSPSAAVDANAVVEQMTRNDVRATLWSIDDPYRFRIHGIDELTDPDLCLVYTRRPYPADAEIPEAAVRDILACFRRLRFMDETLYLRSGSLNIFNGIIGLTFSCDGSHYMPWREFLDKDLGFWLGTPATPCG